MKREIRTDFLIIGAGIIGLSLARNLREKFPNAEISIIEKESDIGWHSSGRNSGVLHAGFYYYPDSLKAKFTRQGNKELTNYCLEKGLSINRCGKVVVAKSEEELETLSNDELIALAKEKGLEDILLLDADGNLLNRDQVIKALVEGQALTEGTIQELESLSNDALIELAQAKGLEDKIILDEDGNLVNRDELIEALREGAAETELAVAELQKAGGTFVLYFAYDDTEIDEAATRVIIEHANFMQNNPSVRLRLEGHADERGTREYNLALGENRALSVKEVLGLYNLEDRVIVVSYGEERPVAIEHNEEAWEMNRRVEFVYY
jgi:peptidoglycan-associated lipoprotein